MVWKRYLYTFVHSHVVTSGQTVGTTQMPADKEIDKQNVVYPHSGVVLRLEEALGFSFISLKHDVT